MNNFQVLSPVQVLSLLRELGAVLVDGHFVYKSDLHGEVYINKDVIYTDTDIVSHLCWQIAREFMHEQRIDVIVGPVVGGVILSQWTTHHLNRLSFRNRKVLAAFADKVDDGLVLKRGYEKIVAGMHVLVVEDILTTGASARNTVKAVEAYGGTVIGVAAICNRGGVTAEMLDVSVLYTLTDIDAPTWTPDECPLCKLGVPVNRTIGHGDEFVKAHAT